MARIYFKFDVNNELTREEMNKSIKRLNQRIFDVARKFGTESALYKQYENLIEQLPVEMQRTTTRSSKGVSIKVSQIAKPSTYYNGDELIKNAISGTLNRIARKKTASEELKKLIDVIKEDDSLLEEVNKELRKKNKSEITLENLNVEQVTFIMGRLSEVGDYINAHKNEYLYNVAKDDKEGKKMNATMKHSKKSYTELMQVVSYMKKRENGTIKGGEKKNMAQLEKAGIIKNNKKQKSENLKKAGVIND